MPFSNQSMSDTPDTLATPAHGPATLSGALAPDQLGWPQQLSERATMKNTPTAFDRLFAQGKLYFEERFENIIGKHLECCRSPIEENMLRAMAFHELAHQNRWPIINGLDFWTANPIARLVIDTQVSIDKYVVDFLVTHQGINRSVVVECDGHDFHEKTKEQAAHDKKRDRELVLLGYTTLRFTGSEIHRDPWECATTVANVLESIWVEELEREMKVYG